MQSAFLAIYTIERKLPAIRKRGGFKLADQLPLPPSFGFLPQIGRSNYAPHGDVSYPSGRMEQCEPRRRADIFKNTGIDV
jgi:hypothetical protein